MISLRGDKFKMIILLGVTFLAIAGLVYTVYFYDVWAEFFGDKTASQQNVSVDTVAPALTGESLNLNALRDILAILKDKKYTDLRPLLTEAEKAQLAGIIKPEASTSTAETSSTTISSTTNPNLRPQDLRNGNPFLPF